MGYTFNPEEFHMGMNVEMEHQDVTKGNMVKTAKIAAAHLTEKPNYYTLLQKYVEKPAMIKLKELLSQIAEKRAARMSKYDTGVHEEKSNDDDTETVSVREPATPEEPYGRLVKKQVKKDKRSGMQSTAPSGEEKPKPKSSDSGTKKMSAKYKASVAQAKAEFDKWDAERKAKEKKKKEVQAQVMGKKAKKSGGTPPQQS